MAERDIERAFMNAVEDYGGECVKLISPGVAGMPDRLVLFRPGTVAFVECKATAKSVISQQQHVAITLLDSLGFRVHILHTIENAGPLALAIMSHQPWPFKS